jgi:CRP/FNR family transcriptional regulator, cyclic AMP receptor protein
MLVTMNEEVQMLHTSDILEPLSEGELEEIARNNPDVRLQEGEILFGPEEVGERLFIVKEGRIELYKTREGKDITIAIMDQGRMFGEMALTTQRTREIYAQAIETSLLISLNQEAVENLILEKPKVGMRLIKKLSERVRDLERRLDDVSLKEMPARLASLILQLVENEGVETQEGYEIAQRYTHEQLANMLGVNRVSVTRAFRTLRESQVVEVKSRLIHVKDLEALGQAAEEKHRAKKVADSEDYSMRHKY